MAARTLCWGLEGAGCGWGVGQPQEHRGRGLSGPPFVPPHFTSGPGAPAEKGASGRGQGYAGVSCLPGLLDLSGSPPTQPPGLWPRPRDPPRLVVSASSSVPARGFSSLGSWPEAPSAPDRPSNSPHPRLGRALSSPPLPAGPRCPSLPSAPCWAPRSTPPAGPCPPASSAHRAGFWEPAHVSPGRRV